MNGTFTSELRNDLTLRELPSIITTELCGRCGGKTDRVQSLVCQVCASDTSSFAFGGKSPIIPHTYEDMNYQSPQSEIPNGKGGRL